MTPRNIEKLKAIGYGPFDEVENLRKTGSHRSEADFWFCAKAHAQSPDGMKATRSDKERLICGDSGHITIDHRQIPGVPDRGWFVHLVSNTADGGKCANGESPEQAIDRLFWSMS
jgi:hypothetical protein